MKTLINFITEDCQDEILDESYKFKRKTGRQWQGVGFGTSSAEHELHHEGKPTGITLDSSSFGYAIRHKDKRVKKAYSLKDAKETAINYHKNLKEDWQKVNRQDKTDGLSQKAVDAYRRENPGSKLQTAVTEKNPKGKRAERRKSFCRRMKGMKARLTSAETARDPDSRINKALRRWNC
jgi:uncharacterized protein with von Willebrand factor type A (vWA) domain